MFGLCLCNERYSLSLREPADLLQDVPTLPSGSKAPCGIMIEELDVYLELLAAALTRFDTDTASALEGAAAMQDIQGLEPDIMPREEVFLISSFILNLRQTA